MSNTKNSNLPHGHGELQLNKFEPFPKNPPISKIFREILIPMNKIAEILNISVGGVKYHIEKMKKAGIIEHVGSTKKGKWIVHKV